MRAVHSACAAAVLTKLAQSPPLYSVWCEQKKVLDGQIYMMVQRLAGQHAWHVEWLNGERKMFGVLRIRVSH